MASVTQPSADAASIIETAHEIRITSHGKYNTWVDFALRHFESNEDRPLTLHTLPLQVAKSSEPHRTGLDEGGSDIQVVGSHGGKRDRMHPSLSLIPRLISVVEIIKREYVKKLDPLLAEKGCLSGLHQYNELGTLDSFGEETEDDQVREERRLDSLASALKGTNHLRQRRTTYMKITLSRRNLQLNGTTHQKPVIRKLPRSARQRARRKSEQETQRMNTSQVNLPVQS